MTDREKMYKDTTPHKNVICTCTYSMFTYYMYMYVLHVYVLNAYVLYYMYMYIHVYVHVYVYVRGGVLLSSVLNKDGILNKRNFEISSIQL